MKKIYLFFLCFLCATPLMAQPTSSIETKQIEQMLQKNGRNTTDDEMIAYIQNLPFEYRQYVVPAMHESKYTSQKVRTHPDIIIWKGKLPTRIAPQLQEWAKTHLKNLPAGFYPALMPEMWPSPNQEYVPQSDIAQLLQGIDADTKPNPNSVLNKLDSPRVKIVGEALTADDVSRLAPTFRALEEFYATRPDYFTFMTRLLDAGDPQFPMIIRLAVPFHALMARLTKMGYKNEINALLQKQGWKDNKEFANKADRLLKAYRAHSLKPSMAIELYKIRKSYGPDSPDASQRAQWMYANFFETSAEDMQAVAPHLKEIRKAFWNKGMILAGAMVYLD